MEKPIIAALVRSIMGAAFAAFTVYVTLVGDGEISGRRMFAAVAGAGISYITARGGVEGIFDQVKKPNQNIPPASNLDDPPAR